MRRTHILLITSVTVGLFIIFHYLEYSQKHKRAVQLYATHHTTYTQLMDKASALRPLYKDLRHSLTASDAAKKAMHKLSQGQYTTCQGLLEQCDEMDARLESARTLAAKFEADYTKAKSPAAFLTELQERQAELEQLDTSLDTLLTTAQAFLGKLHSKPTATTPSTQPTL